MFLPTYKETLLCRRCIWPGISHLYYDNLKEPGFLGAGLNLSKLNSDVQLTCHRSRARTYEWGRNAGTACGRVFKRRVLLANFQKRLCGQEEISSKTVMLTVCQRRSSVGY